MSASLHYASPTENVGDAAYKYHTASLGSDWRDDWHAPPRAANAPAPDAADGFCGIGLSIQNADEGLWLYVITKLHHDPQHHHILETSASDEHIVAHWRAWGKLLHLPLLVEREAGVMTGLERFMGDVACGPRTHTRRPLRFGAQRSSRRRLRRLNGWRSCVPHKEHTHA